MASDRFDDTAQAICDDWYSDAKWNPPLATRIASALRSAASQPPPVAAPAPAGDVAALIAEAPRRAAACRAMGLCSEAGLLDRLASAIAASVAVPAGDAGALIAEARRLADAATPGPWAIDREELSDDFDDEEQETAFPISIGPIESWEPVDDDPALVEADAAFIARCRTLVPELASALAAAEKTRREMIETYDLAGKDVPRE